MKGEIVVKGAKENNLKNIDVKIPWHTYTVVTGLSGSGKSSFALDTLYAEGLRRYVESLSTYARQFLEKVDRPHMDDISGLPPAVAIESRNPVRNSRSTVGTTTEVYDYLRLLYSKIGRIICPNCNIPVYRKTPEIITKELIQNHDGQRAYITFSLEGKHLNSHDLLTIGFTRVYSDDKVIDLEELEEIPKGAEVLVDRIAIKKSALSRIADSVELALEESDYINVRIVDGDTLTFTEKLECTSCQTQFAEPTQQLFSFNSPQGACETCKGFGNILQVDPALIVPDDRKSLSAGAIEPMTKPSFRGRMRKFLSFAQEAGIDTRKPYSELTAEEKGLLFEGNGVHRGINGFFDYLERKNYKMHVRVFLSKYRSAFDCPDCEGTRLKPLANYVFIGGRTISQLTGLSIEDLKLFFEDLELTDYEYGIAEELLKQIVHRLDFLVKVGLGYLKLARLTRSLSGGESQRVNLACQLGSTLTETLYIMDEPSIGLHPRDISKLVSIIKELRDRDNTVVVVEHDHEMISSADHIVELGPLAGEAGGEVVYQGEMKGFLGRKNSSLTKDYINGKDKIPVPTKRRSGSGHELKIAGASENNLKNIDVPIPLKVFTCVTGVSGSGKSSLVSDVLYSALARKFRGDIERVGSYKEITGDQYLADVLMLDQSPIGKNLRSNPITYIKCFDEIRKLMAQSWSARSKGLTPSHFSFNVPGGRCESCKGEGRLMIEMHFLADVYVTCDSCNGKRFTDDVLAVTYRGKNINQILDLTVDEAINFFYEHPPIGRKLKILQDVGLGYLRLGQPAPTLSGGEAQRIKIARELGRKGGKDILYILDEPTVGLHAEDVKKLLSVLNKLVYAGNTVLVVEHNLDVIKSADHVVDLGPEGGKAGGFVVATGTPEQITKVRKSHTGKYLKKVL